jgi:hypothetical protein
MLTSSSIEATITYFLNFVKKVEPRDHTGNDYDGLQQSANECDLSCVSGLQGATLLVACAQSDPGAFPHGRIPSTLAMHLHMGKDFQSDTI